MAGPQPQATYEQLYRAFTAMERAHERWLTAAGSNGARYAVLASLAATSGPVTPSHVSETTGRSPNAISPLLRGLHQEGLIKRSANAADRRSHYVALTAAGRRAATKLQREETAFVRSLLRGRSARELATMTKTLAAIEERAGAMRESH